MKTNLEGNTFHFICHVSGGGVDHARDARSDDGHLDQHGRQVKIPCFFAIFPRTQVRKNTIRDGGSTAQETAYTFYTFDTVDMVYTVDTV